MPSRSCNVCKTWLPVSSHVRESMVQQHNANTEGIALAACEVSHNIQGTAAYIQGAALCSTTLREDVAAKLHNAFSLIEIRDCEFTYH